MANSSVQVDAFEPTGVYDIAKKASIYQSLRNDPEDSVRMAALGSHAQRLRLPLGVHGVVTRCVLLPVLLLTEVSTRTGSLLHFLRSDFVLVPLRPQRLDYPDYNSTIFQRILEWVAYKRLLPIQNDSPRGREILLKSPALLFHANLRAFMVPKFCLGQYF